MPLSAYSPRREIHHRSIDMKAYVREDGLFDVEAHLVDTKPFAFARIVSPVPLPAGAPLHDLWVRLTVDDNYVVRAIEASSDVTPYPLCKEAEVTLSVLVGERIASGWSARVKERLRGAASCTHLMELLIPLATTALQGIIGARREGQTSVDTSKVPVKLDSCYAYGRHRAVVQRFWPQLFQPETGTPPDTAEPEAHST
ncbi:DUF2889 domain-containing protein [Cupriavidus basilensis]|uniref:DUF2889 domain-containing protein n=1 Tax=Cupriavidus basilensis TaxID=68895 RepID=A0ABT6B4D8_9BURK|nr:DUF2889 domain-containing protein [Cupriavidus basilensis]MDF3838826.1 DUF2889 domain-containing protein [Cupriavidus basilensis]